MRYADFGAVQKKQSIRPVALDSVFYVIADNKYSVHHSRIPDSHVLVVAQSGRGTVQIKERKMEVGQGNILLFDASQEEFQFFCSDASWKFWWFEFRCADEEFLDVPLECPWQAELNDMNLQLCEKALSSLKQDDAKTASCLLSALLCLLQKGSNKAEDVRTQTELFRRADQYIFNNLATVNVTTLAQHLRVSERMLLNLFQSALGIRTVEYIQNIRMDIACQMLTTGRNAISEIAEQLGYADQFAFSKCFRKRFGISPSEYRKREKTAVDVYPYAPQAAFL